MNLPNYILTRSKDTSDFLSSKIEAKYLTSSAFASPSIGGAEIAMPTASSEISMNIYLHLFNNYDFIKGNIFLFFYKVGKIIFFIIKIQQT